MIQLLLWIAILWFNPWYGDMRAFAVPTWFYVLGGFIIFRACLTNVVRTIEAYKK